MLGGTMQIDPSSGFPAVGRRRVTTLTKEEWREALEQQRREKEELKRSKPRHEQDNQTHDRVDSHTPPVPPVENAEAAGANRSGRRFVAPMSAEEWKASLVQQIREKELQREQQKRGHTAPEHTMAIKQPESPDAPRSHSASVAPSCLPAVVEDASTLVGRRRRGGAPQQSREEYLRSLQEQIELKKKREEAESTTHGGRGRLGRRRNIEDDDCSDGFWPPLPTPARASERTSDTAPSAAEISEKTTPGSGGDMEVCAAEPVNAVTTEARPGPAVNLAVTMDPAALSKLFELCEGMKQQNEELKQQLRDQQSVLATLAGTTPSSTSALTQAKSVLKQAAPPKKKLSKPDVEQTSREVKTKTRKSPPHSAQTNPAALPAKHTSKKLTLAKPKAVEKSESCDSTAPTQAVPATISNQTKDTSTALPTADPGPECLPPQSKVTKPSRLVQPRVVPRLRSAQLLAAKTNSTFDMPGTVPGPEDPTTPENFPPQPLAEPPEETTETESPLQHTGPDQDADIPSGHVEASEPEAVQEIDHPTISLPHLQPSPPIRRKSVPTSHAPTRERLSLPLLTTRSSFVQAKDDCLDHNASSTSTQLFRSALTSSIRLRTLDEGDLDAQCSSVAMLDGASAMIPFNCSGLPL